VSENDDSHCAGTTKVEVTSHRKERLKRKASSVLGKLALENCGCDMLRQTVPGVNSSKIYLVITCQCIRDHFDDALYKSTLLTYLLAIV